MTLRHSKTQSLAVIAVIWFIALTLAQNVSACLLCAPADINGAASTPAESRRPAEAKPIDLFSLLERSLDGHADHTTTRQTTTAKSQLLLTSFLIYAANRSLVDTVCIEDFLLIPPSSALDLLRPPQR